MLTSTSKNDRNTKEESTTPSTTPPGPPTTSMEVKACPGILSSVGKFMSGSGKKLEVSGDEVETEKGPSQDGRLTTPPVLPPRSDYITPEQKRFLSALNSEAEKVVRAALKACFLPSCRLET